MGLKRFFFGKSSKASNTSDNTNNNNTNKTNNNTNKTNNTSNTNHKTAQPHRLKTSPYDSAPERDAPVKGSYPVAGNGPNILDELQRSRARKDVRSASASASAIAIARSPSSTSLAIPPNISRHRDDPFEYERPRTAPHPGVANGGQYRGFGDLHGRTQSGFSMRSPPNLYSSRRNSMYSSSSIPPPLPSPIPEVPLPPREIKTYQPRKASADASIHGNAGNAGNASTNGDTSINGNGNTSINGDGNTSINGGNGNTSINGNVFNIFTPPPVPASSHTRNTSQASQRTYVDLLDAQSAIKPETSQHRAKASGVRNYGEDVADRNLVEERSRENKFDRNLPGLNSLKSAFAPRNRSSSGGRHYRSSSGQAYGLDFDLGSIGDDIPPIQPLRIRSASSNRSATTSPPPPPGPVYPPRLDSVQSFSTNRVHDDRTDVPNGAHDRRGRAKSPVSRASVYEQSHRQPSVSSRADSIPPVPARGRARTLPREPPPVSLDIRRVTSPSQITQDPNKGALYEATRSGSMTSFTTARTSSVTGTRARKSSIPHSAFSTMNPPRENNVPRTTLGSSSNQNPAMAITGSKEPISLEGVVDLSNTVDTDVKTKTLPAVTHERVTPTVHEIREERITQEIHTHDVFHRILPVIETEILPTKHYIPSADGKGLVEIPEHMVPGRTTEGRPSRNWAIMETGMGRGDHGAAYHPRPPNRRRHSLAQSPGHPHINEEAYEGAEAPVVFMTREGKPKTLDRPSTSYSAKAARHNSLDSREREPILTSKKEYITKSGVPKTEYVWRHPPVFETADGKTYPIHNGLKDLITSTNSFTLSSTLERQPRASEESFDLAGAEYGAISSPSSKNGNHELFRDSGYGSSAMLPGLRQGTSGMSDVPRNSVDEFDEKIRLGRVLDDAYGSENGVRDHVGRGMGSGEEEGEATKALRRMREKKRSESARLSFSSGSGGAGSQKGKEREVDFLKKRGLKF